jgi:trk system potassium uptake protein
VLVIGLGRFGSSLARELMALGHEVLGVDFEAERVQEFASELSQTLRADTTSVEALKQLGATEFRQVVVAIGSDIESSILTTLALVDLGIPNIWAKAINASHGRILDRIGAHHVVLPEAEMGRRVAHLVTNRMIDYIALDENLSLVECLCPDQLVGRTLAEAQVRTRFSVSVVCVKPEQGGFRMATPDWELRHGDILLVAGTPTDAESFGQLS